MKHIKNNYALFALIIGLFLTASAQAATLTVNSLADTVAADGNCTLREAIVNANADNQSGSVDCTAGAGADTINISVAGSINLLSGLPILTTDISIVGLGAAQTTVRRDSAAATEFGIFSKNGGTSTISEMTIRDGIVRGANGANGVSVSGGGLRNGSGALTLTNVIITNNQAIGGNGSTGTGGNSFGGGILNSGTLTIIGSTITNNTAMGGNGATNGGDGIGGGIVINPATVTITNTVISGNTAAGGTGTSNGGNAFGGGIVNFGTTNITLDNSSVINNTAVGGNGTAFGQSGGIEISSTTVLTANNSIISGNIASGSISFGGALLNFGTVNLTNSTVSNNTATDDTGGLDNIGTLRVTNSTISGNSVTNPTATDAGGGISSFGGTVTLTNATITDNFTASPNSASGVNSNGFTVNVKNTIIAGNRNNQTSADVVGTSFVSNGYNLIGNVGTVATFNQTGDQTGTSGAPLNPQLAPLANNGGPTETHRLLTGSPAIDQGAAATDPITNTSITIDQRGFPRPVDSPSIPNATLGNGSDIGAFEEQAPTAASVSVAGKVKTPTGKGLSNAFVTLTDTSGNQRLARTSAFGYFHFEDVAAGETYIVGVFSKRYRFTPQVLSISQDIVDLELTGENLFFKSPR